MAPFRVRGAAKADLKGIARFTERNRGRRQRDRYLTELDRAFHRLAENHGLGKACEQIRAGYRAFPVGSHVIFYRVGAGDTVEIVRVLHQRMDVSSRLPPE